MRSLQFTIAKNALANVVRGGASAVVAIVLPHFLTHSLGSDRFAGWALMLQLAAYANYLDFGLQTAVARYLAAALEKHHDQRRDRLFSNALAILGVAGTLAIGGFGFAAWQLPHLFHSIPVAFAGEIGRGLLILGVAAALGLPLSVYTGVLIGMQRNEFPAIAIAASRLFGAMAVILVAQHTHSLAWLALCIGGCNLLAGIVQWIMVKKLLPALRFSVAFLDRAMTSELIRYCSTLSVWSFAMLLVSGLDVTIVGLFNFQAVGAYSIAVTLIMFFTGLNAAAFSAMLAPIAVLQARQDYSRIRHLVLVTTRLNSYASMGGIVVAFLFGRALVRLWVGPSYLALTLPVLEILLVAQTIRLVGSAYGTALLSMGLQRYGIISALVEGVSNLLLSVLGMVFIGAVGVAWATLIAALIGLAVITFGVLPRIRELSISPSRFIQQGIIIPFLPFVPFCLWVLWRHWYESRTNLANVFSIVSASLVLLLTISLLHRGINGVRDSSS